MGVLIVRWLVLPDRPDARRVVAGWPALSRWVLSHASGNPWLVGSLDQHEVTVASVGSLRVVVIGACPVTAKGGWSSTRGITAGPPAGGPAGR